mmetsp:Transcript_20523/g.52063  ORF Transcript_20523/g.52063 Transcript_20523/m.52063 type:complete len:259 (-) Transcript_20523:701-1477(-)
MPAAAAAARLQRLQAAASARVLARVLRQEGSSSSSMRARAAARRGAAAAPITSNAIATRPARPAAATQPAPTAPSTAAPAPQCKRSPLACSSWRTACAAASGRALPATPLWSAGSCRRRCRVLGSCCRLGRSAQAQPASGLAGPRQLPGGFRTPCGAYSHSPVWSERAWRRPWLLVRSSWQMPCSALRARCAPTVRPGLAEQAAAMLVVRAAATIATPVTTMAALARGGHTRAGHRCLVLLSALTPSLRLFRVSITKL